MNYIGMSGTKWSTCQLYSHFIPWLPVKSICYDLIRHFRYIGIIPLEIPYKFHYIPTRNSSYRDIIWIYRAFFCVISIHHLMMSHSMSRFAQLQWSFEFWIGTRPRFTSSSWWLWASDRTGWSCARGHWCDAAVLTRVFLMFDRDCLLLTASFYKSVLITWHVIHRLQVNLRNLAILLSWWNSSCSTFRSFIC